MTRKAFRKKLKIRMVLGFLIGVIGVGTFLLAYPGIDGMKDRLSDFMNGFYCGTGGGLAGAGFATAAISILYLRKPNLFEQKFVAETDERNRFLLFRAGHLAFFISLYALYLSVIATGLLYPLVATVLLAVMGAMGLIFLVTYLVFKQLY